ncbi:HNH endonuclease family protein [Vibrio cyclitrophicus]|uniref:hypothetical protein n=1 Tax=Vibrio cyclitrophicus TaxID=47951 RepID=UPI0011B716A4|nr:hypothetical protein [Vibrio cyclitrophicus]
MRKTEHNKFKPNKLRFYPRVNPEFVPRVNLEIRSNIRKFLEIDNDDKLFNYYKNLKTDIALLTKGRCSYCGKYTDLSIEHYRPKDGIVVNKLQPKNMSKPGYFWLASDWYNLHPACTACNCIKTREIVDTNTVIGAPKVVGKGNYFPLYGGHTHAPLLMREKTSTALSFSSKQVKKERPLLFNPSKELPASLFEYSIVRGRRGKVLIIQPKVGISPYKQAIAETTIDLLGLNSKDQAKARMDTYILTNETLNNIDAINNFDDQEVIEQLEQLCSYIDENDNGSYLGMIESMLGHRLRTISHQIDNHLNHPRSNNELLSDVVTSIERLLDNNTH